MERRQAVGDAGLLLMRVSSMVRRRETTWGVGRAGFDVVVWAGVGWFGLCPERLFKFKAHHEYNHHSYIAAESRVNPNLNPQSR